MLANRRSKLRLAKRKSFASGGKRPGKYIRYTVIYVYAFVPLSDKIYSTTVIWWASKFKEKSLFAL